MEFGTYILLSLEVQPLQINSVVDSINPPFGLIIRSSVVKDMISRFYLMSPRICNKIFTLILDTTFFPRMMLVLKKTSNVITKYLLQLCVHHNEIVDLPSIGSSTPFVDNVTSSTAPRKNYTYFIKETSTRNICM